YEYNGQAYDYFMPPLSGNNGDATSGHPDTYLSVTREPTYGDSKINFQDMVDKILGHDVCEQDKIIAQVQFLNKAALESSVGGPFYPGIEITYVAYDENTINSGAFQPGDINAYMALPWQADFYECNTRWWPAQRPDIVIPKEQKDEKRKIQSDDFVNWTRGLRQNEASDEPKWGDLDMVRVWDRYVDGFVVEKENVLGNNKAFVEVEHADIYGVNG
ncbi:5650_t:CDS:2, partial [Racocetra fulgida]